jgi:hypothetical protein
VRNPGIVKKRAIRGYELSSNKDKIAERIQVFWRQIINYLSDFSNLTILLYSLFVPTFLLLGTFIGRQSSGVSAGDRGLDTIEIILKSIVFCTVLQVFVLCRIALMCIDNSESLSEKNKMRILIASVLIALMLTYIFGFMSL